MVYGIYFLTCISIAGVGGPQGHTILQLCWPQKWHQEIMFPPLVHYCQCTLHKYKCKLEIYIQDKWNTRKNYISSYSNHINHLSYFSLSLPISSTDTKIHLFLTSFTIDKIVTYNNAVDFILTLLIKYRDSISRIQIHSIVNYFQFWFFLANILVYVTKIKSILTWFLDRRL